MTGLNISMTIENGKEPSDNDTNALKQNDMVKHDHDDNKQKKGLRCGRITL